VGRGRGAEGGEERVLRHQIAVAGAGDIPAARRARPEAVWLSLAEALQCQGEIVDLLIRNCTGCQEKGAGEEKSEPGQRVQEAENSGTEEPREPQGEHREARRRVYQRVGGEGRKGVSREWPPLWASLVLQVPFLFSVQRVMGLLRHMGAAGYRVSIPHLLPGAPCAATCPSSMGASCSPKPGSPARAGRGREHHASCDRGRATALVTEGVPRLS